MKKLLLILIVGVVSMVNTYGQINPTTQIKPGSPTEPEILITDTAIGSPTRGRFVYEPIKKSVVAIVTNEMSKDSVREIFLNLTSYTDLQSVNLSTLYPLFRVNGVIQDGVYRIMTYSPDNMLKRINLTNLGGLVGNNSITNEFTGNGNYTTIMFINQVPIQHKFTYNGWLGVTDSIRYNRDLISDVSLKVKGLQRCGEPIYIPKANEWHIQIDTCNSYTYSFERGIWYNNTNILQEAAPYVTSGNVSNARIFWYKPSLNIWHESFGNAWITKDSFVIDDLLGKVNVWRKDNFFDKRIFVKGGIFSDSTVTTVGLNTSSNSATKAAMILKGVQVNADTVVTTNFTLDGRYGSVGFNCLDAAKDCFLPDAALTNNWIFKIRTVDGSVYPVHIKSSLGVTIYTINNDRINTVFQCVNGNYKRIQ